MELVILAAGMGSRFGGLKQIEPIDEWGNFIIDYSVFDAIQAGFDRVIFVIKEELQEEFKKTIGKRIENKIEVKYVYQKIDDVPFDVGKVKRTKPWGTGHAIMAARKAIKENFLIINSDDFYGKESFTIAYNFLKSLPSTSKSSYANVAFRVSNTLTENGGVKRGVCFYDEEKKLNEIIESVVIEQNKKILATPLNGNIKSFEIDSTQLVSMNMFAFSYDFLAILDNEFNEFYNNNIDNLETSEFLTTDIVSKLIKEKKATVQILETSSKWHGVTYSKDKEKVVREIKKLIDAGQYKKGLW